MKHILCTLFVWIIPLYANSEVIWKRYNIGDFMSVEMPDVVELRDPNSKAGRMIDGLMTWFYGEDETNDIKLTFIPTGLNSNDNRIAYLASCRYARIIVTVCRNNELDQSDFDYVFKEDLDELERSYRKRYETYTTILKWEGVKIENIGGKKAIVMNFERQSATGGGAICVMDYMVFTGGRQIEVVISYRKTESEHWKSLCDIKGRIHFKDKL